MKDTYQVQSLSVMDDVEIERLLTRIAHQILQATTARRISRLWTVTRGDLLAKRLVEKIEQIVGSKGAPGQP